MMQSTIKESSSSKRNNGASSTTTTSLPLVQDFDGKGNAQLKKKIIYAFGILGVLTQSIIFYRYVVFLSGGSPHLTTMNQHSHAMKLFKASTRSRSSYSGNSGSSGLVHRKLSAITPDVEPIQPTYNKNKYGLLLVVPGIGEAERIPMLKTSLAAIKNTLPTKHKFECLVYCWNKDLLDQVIREVTECTVEYNKGKWTHHMKKVPSPLPKWVTHTAVLIDDIDISKVNVLSFLDLMTKANYDVGSAAFNQWHYDALHSRFNSFGCLTHRTDFADVLFTVFKREMWPRWQDHIDVENNDYGWGYDVTLADTFDATVGIIDTALADHSGKCENGGDCTRSYSEDRALVQLWKWITAKAPLRVREERHAQEYWRYVTVQRPEHFKTCDLTI